MLRMNFKVKNLNVCLSVTLNQATFCLYIRCKVQADTGRGRKVQADTGRGRKVQADTGRGREVQAGRQKAEPNHVNPKLIVEQKLTNKTLRFQEKWYSDFIWLHYSPGVNGILWLEHLEMRGQIWQRTPIKLSQKTGFQNWKKATQKFAEHAESSAHKVSVTSHCHKLKPVDLQLSRANATQQQESRRCLMKIVGSVQLLARQGNARRGHLAEEGNLY